VITQGRTLIESLEILRKHELMKYDNVINDINPCPDATEAQDLLNERKSYSYQAHRLVVGILTRCGFQCIQDKNNVQDDVLETNIRNMIPVLEKHMDKLLYEFEVRKANIETLKVEKDRAKFLKRSLTFINSILQKMYGIKILKSSMYVIVYANCSYISSQ